MVFHLCDNGTLSRVLQPWLCHVCYLAQPGPQQCMHKTHTAGGLERWLYKATIVARVSQDDTVVDLAVKVNPPTQVVVNTASPNS